MELKFLATGKLRSDWESGEGEEDEGDVHHFGEHSLSLLFHHQKGLGLIKCFLFRSIFRSLGQTYSEQHYIVCVSYVNSTVLF